MKIKHPQGKVVVPRAKKAAQFVSKEPSPIVPAIAVCADVHIGNHAKFGGKMTDGLNARARVTLDTFGRAIDAARAAGARALFVAGDLFHSRRPEPAVIAAVQHRLKDRAADLPVVVVPGNHDMLDASSEGGNTACAPLWEEASIVDRPQWFHYSGVDVLAVPYEGKIPMAAHLDVVLAQVADGGFLPENSGRCPRVLVTHVGVWRTEDAPPWMKRAKDGMEAGRLLVAMINAGIGQAFVGNYHNHERFKDGLRPEEIIQVGTLNPGGFGDSGNKDRGLLALTDGAAVQLREIRGPRFVVVDDLAKLPVGCTDAGWAYYVRHEAAAPVLGKHQFFADLAGYEHHPPPAVAAADETPDRTEQLTDEAAIAAYAGEMVLPVGVTQDGVLELARDCWRRSA